jgi:hypothetical protein
LEQKGTSVHELELALIHVQYVQYCIEKEVEMGEDERRKRFDILSMAQIRQFTAGLQYKLVHLLLPRLGVFDVK